MWREPPGSQVYAMTQLYNGSFKETPERFFTSHFLAEMQLFRLLSDEGLIRRLMAPFIGLILPLPHSAVFNGGLLRLLDINLTKQDKPIS